MKKILNILELSVIMAFIAFVLFSGFAKGQNPDYSRKYRVIAYKTGHPEINSTSNEVNVVPAMSLYVPNTFTPNGDGLNDTFGAYGEAVKVFTMQIYDRWGAMIFEADDMSKQWDGTYKGKMSSQGTYVYKITAQAASGTKISKNGTVNLIQ